MGVSMGHHRKFAKLLCLWIVCALSLAGAGASNLPLPSTAATESINVRDLRKHLEFLASDELGGRYTISPSNRIAARYLATQLESYGYRGAAHDGSFFQKVPLGYRSVDGTKSLLTLTAEGTTQEFKYYDSFASEVPINTDVQGELVFAGYGISSPARHYDDYKNIDVRGKIVVLVNGEPEALKSTKLKPDEVGQSAAISHGAVAMIRLLPAQFTAQWEQAKYFFHQQNLGLPPLPGPGGKLLPVVSPSPQLVGVLARVMGKDASYLISPAGKAIESMALKATASIKVAVEVKDAPPAQNVAGILEGSDPKLKDEFVVFSAHYDHLKTSDSGEVFNGADDDGSGTVGVLDIAQAFAIGPRPRRSILIIFHTGEELGLFGSEYNADYDPVVPMEKLVADFNIDMIGRSRPEGDNDPRDRYLTDKNSIYIIGSDKLSTELHRLNEETNSETAKMRFDYTYNDERHPERFYYRSDHYNYAKHGVPIIFYFTGVHRDYHQTTDDVDKIDFEKMERIDRMIFAVGYRVANLDHRVVVDKHPVN